MAWYRAGGGGIPSAIKTDMNAVLNKKFGTSTDYPPTDWAPSVNLLGPLPEKTASGSVASITDGADGVPVKNWGVTVAPTLSGVSSVVCTQAGKNLFDKDATPYQTGKYIISTSVIGSSDFTYTNNANYNVYRIKIDKNTSYVISSIKANAPCWGLMSTSGLVTYVYPNNGGSEGVNITLTTGATDAYLFVSVAVTGTYKCDDIVQIEKSSTATTYEQYSGTVTTVSLGRTIYGGSVDVVAGTGTETYQKIVLDGTQEIGLANWKPTTGTSAWLYAPSVTPNLLNNYLTAYNLGNIVCDVLPTVPYNTTAQRIDESTTKGISVVGTNNWGLAVRVEDDTLRTKADINAWLANNPITVIYKVATPTDFTFTPITPIPETPLGASNFWSDEGDSDVTYRADISLLLGGN